MTPGDVRLRLPLRWHGRSAPETGIVVAARPAVVPASGVSPEIVVRAVPVDLDLAPWRAAALAELADQLVDLAVEDADAFELDGHQVHYHRFAHRVGVVDVVCEQWAWVVEGLGVTLTGIVAREDYATYCDVFEAVAATVDLRPRAA